MSASVNADVAGSVLADSKLGQVLDEIGVGIDPALLDLALTHRSWAYENDHAPHNERLEFLGDAVLGEVVTDYLYRNFPDDAEGQLAKMRAAIVSAVSLAGVARQLYIGSLIKLGHGEETTGGAGKTSILADTMEAIIGAVFLTGGQEAANKYVLKIMVPRIKEVSLQGQESLDWKTSLQEIAAVQGFSTPVYEVTSSGPEHDLTYSAFAVLDQEKFGPGVGHNKKIAEQQAAEIAYCALKERET